MSQLNDNSDASTEIRSKLDMAVTVAENAEPSIKSVNIEDDEKVTVDTFYEEITLKQDAYTSDEIVWTVWYDDGQIIRTDDFREAFEEFCDLVL